MRIVNDRARLSHLFGHGPSPFSETQQWAIIAFSGTKRTPTRLFGLSESIDDPVRPAADGGVEDQPRMVILRVAQQIRLAVEDEARPFEVGAKHGGIDRSDEHTSELQSLMRISYAVFCLKKK